MLACKTKLSIKHQLFVRRTHTPSTILLQDVKAKEIGQLKSVLFSVFNNEKTITVPQCTA